MKFCMQVTIMVCLICFVSGNTNAQQFELMKHGEVKKLDFTSNWYIVQKLGNEDECCNSRRLFGHIIDLSSDSMEVQVKRLQTRRTDSEKSYSSNVKFNTKMDFPSYTIAKSDIMNMEEKKGKLNEVFSVSGGILLITTVATAISALLVDGDDRKALFLSAGIQLGASITLISIGRRKKKYIINENNWQF